MKPFTDSIINWFRDGSGKYLKTEENAEITSSGKWQVIKEDTADTKEFGPFDAITVTNFSDYDVNVIYGGNTNRYDVVPSKTILRRGDWETGDVQLFRNIQIENRSSDFAIVANKIVVTIERRLPR